MASAGRGEGVRRQSPKSPHPPVTSLQVTWASHPASSLGTNLLTHRMKETDLCSQFRKENCNKPFSGTDGSLSPSLKMKRKCFEGSIKFYKQF